MITNRIYIFFKDCAEWLPIQEIVSVIKYFCMNYIYETSITCHSIEYQNIQKDKLDKDKDFRI